MRKYFFLLLLLYPLMSNSAIEFKYTYNVGDQYRFLSTVRTQSFFEENDVTTTEILNRIAFKVEEVQGAQGRLIGTVHTSQQAPNTTEAILWKADYPADFWRDERGNYRVDPSFFMPMVRNVPFFPTGDVTIGRKWIASGLEVHDISQLTGSRAPFRIPFTAYYEYIGPSIKEGKEYHHIKVSYSYKANFPPALNLQRENKDYPVRLASSYEQDIYWDIDLGQPAWYVEEFITQIAFKSGHIHTTTGHADAYLIEAKPMDKALIQEQLEAQIAKDGLTGVRVERSEQGIKLVMDDIKFKPNTNEFLPGELVKLAKLGKMLALYPDRDVKISGHTAKATNEAVALQLSEQRALAVADYLLKNRYKTQEHLITEGLGSSQPIADNGTPEGMTKNRRVEITILEN